MKYKLFLGILGTCVILIVCSDSDISEFKNKDGVTKKNICLNHPSRISGHRISKNIGTKFRSDARKSSVKGSTGDIHELLKRETNTVVSTENHYTPDKVNKTLSDSFQLEYQNGENNANAKEKCDNGSKDCSDHGNCTDGQFGKPYTCKCDLGYMGDFCQKVKEKCDTGRVDCNYRGTCSDGQNGEQYKCKCDLRYKGNFCEKVKDKCENGRKDCSDHGNCSDGQNGNLYTCSCDRGYEGDLCEKVIVKCGIGRRDCSYNGNCTDGQNGEKYRCKCDQGHTGEFCQKVIDKCGADGREACSYHGNCTDGQNGKIYTCKCDLGYTGDFCHKVIEKCGSGKKDCSYHGNCIDGQNGGQYTCKCDIGYTGGFCQNVKEKCDTGREDCSHHGNCTDGQTNVQYTCKCDVGYTGNFCEKVKDKCDTGRTDCNDHGNCTDGRNGGKLTCSCDLGYTGYYCEIDCECGEFEKCETMEDNVTCTCIPGYARDKEGDGKCKACDCGKNGTCEITDGQKNCRCKPGYAWDILGDGKCKDCDCGTPQESCKFIGNGKKMCNCTKSRAQLKNQCHDISKCLTVKCGLNEFCNDAKGQCECVHFYKNGSEQCQPNYCQEAGMTLCPKMECLDRKDKPGEVTCYCKDNTYYNGKECIEMDRCSLAQSKKCEQVCNKTDGSCSCFDGYTLNADNTSCSVDTDKHSIPCNKDCGGGFCVKNAEEDVCECPLTHILSNSTCVDLCSANKVPAGMCPTDRCESLGKRGFRCNCTEALGIYKLSENDVTCERKKMCVDEDVQKECQKTSSLCKDNWLMEKGYECVCPDGYTEDSEDGNICKKPCDMVKKEKECADKNGICYLKSFGVADCKCPPMIVADNDGKCTKKAERSYTSYFPVEKKPDYLQDLQNVYSNRSSQTLLHYAGVAKSPAHVNYDILGIDLRESVKYVMGNTYEFADVLHCNISGSIINCLVELKLKSEIESTDLSYFVACVNETCIIPPKLIVDKTSVENAKIRKTDPCNPRIKHELCGEYTNCSMTTEVSFECLCKEGFITIGTPKNLAGNTISICEDIDECKVYNTPCPGNNVCWNTIGSYTCLCAKGHRKKSDNADLKDTACIAVCDPNPCANGGKCFPVDDHSFHCRCVPGFSGRLCDEEDTVLKQFQAAFQRNSAIIGTVLGALFLTTTIFSVITIRRLQKKAKDGNYNAGHRNQIPTEMRHVERNPSTSRAEESGRDMPTPKEKGHLRSGDTDPDYRRKSKQEQRRSHRSYDAERGEIDGEYEEQSYAEIGANGDDSRHVRGRRAEDKGAYST